ncbi:TetR/AcrR family transcriptional regulator [Phenylobacterium aquaticum]|uniref:TetR/AcrR family transcriptional regulator n=1 Tax=Phenylobacterium aquaticum TaxID=1763816 RepID=UPI001F5D9E70|nr:TetR/AcrR family transcriptional regulator [Phenylobacterium aquaticum]MCI3133385.1 TetR/AcrR family transcriptional regulator [Phenylobacterium aquaticum]
MTELGKMSARRAATRGKLLEATLAVIGEKGLHGVSVDGVAKRVGVTKGAVYDNFESKDAMIVAALAGLPDEAMAPFAWPKGRQGTVRDRLRRLGEAIYEGRGDVVRAAVGAAEFQLYALTHEDMKKRLADITSMGPTRTKARLLELFDENELPMPVESFALLLHAIVPGLNQFRASAPRPPSREVVVAMFEGLAGQQSGA